MQFVKLGVLAAAGVFALLFALGSFTGDPKPATGTGQTAATEATPPAITAEHKASLTMTVDAFGAAMKGKDYDVLIETIPVPIMEAMAEQVGMPTEKMRPAMMEQMEAMLASVEIVEFGMDAENAELKQTEDGLIYAIVNTRTLMKTADAAVIEAKTPTLAIMDDDTWHLVRVDNDSQRALVSKVYPGLKGVDFPKATMEAVEG